MIYPKLSTAIDSYIQKFDPTPQQRGQLKYWKSKLGGYRVNQVSPNWIQENLPSWVGPATCNRYLSALSAIYIHNKWTPNPTRQIKRFKEKGRVRFLSDNERTVLLEACKQSSNPHIYTLVVLSLSVGARQSEVLKLTWDRVDLQRGLIYFTGTKNGENRMVPVTGHALELIHNLDRTSKYVFPNRYGSYYRDIDYHWKKVLRRTNIQNFRWHDLRHDCASNLSMAGVDLPSIGQVLGHKSISSTMRYIHLNVNHLRGVLGNLNDMMFPDPP